MKISLRGWLVIGTFTALTAALVTLALPRLNAADGSATASGQLTEDSLGTMLQAMGLEPKKVSKRYDFAFRTLFEGEEWTLSMSSVLSQNGQSVWVMAWLDELPRSAADVPRTALLRLLADNDRLGKGKFFAYIASNRRFVLQRTVENRDMTTAAFRSALQDLGASVVQTYPHWAVANWKESASEPNAANTAANNSGATVPAQVNAPARTAQPAPAAQSPVRR
jgi:hypothetical protein